jgi:predicted nucleic acid-binding protein
MATDGRERAIIDSSVLVNFLRIDRIDLLASHPRYRFVVIDYVRREITDRYPHQLVRLEAALASGLLEGDIDSGDIVMDELAAYADLQKVRIGDGERGAIAAAYARGYAIAINDYRAMKKLPSSYRSIVREDTASLMVSLIRSGVLPLAEADAIKADWEANHRFRLKFSSFGDMV